ncbi:hypothetical protein EGW08_015129 [Elysia chlorotica]|uniref:Uncharacterized protein n=1 Tax=Elysia chlorotica TaxID=188477 RepID=A0A433T6B1_ELYCH|nr:hypothetical protein EGW08_015129 [Elysia chlorotica]
MSTNVRLESVVAAHEPGRHRHVHLEPMRPPAPYDENEPDQRVGRKGNKPPPTAPRPKLSRASSLGRHQARDGETTFAGYRPKDNLYNKTISWLKNLKPWNKHGTTGTAGHNSISSSAVTNGDGGNHHSKDSLYFINSGTGSMSNLNHHHHYHQQNYRKSGSLKAGRLSSSISDRNLSLHIPRHDDDATTAGIEADPALDPGVAVHYPHMHKSGSLRSRSHSQNRYSTSFCPDRDYTADPYIESSSHNLRDYSDPYDAYDVRYGYLNSQSCHGALPGGPQEYKMAGVQDYKQPSQDYRSRVRSGRASQENLYIQSHFSHHDPLPHNHYQPQYQHYLNHQPSHSSNGHHHHHHHQNSSATDRSNGDRPAHQHQHHHHYHQQQQHYAQHNYAHDQQQPQQQKQKHKGREGSAEELSIPQAAAVVSGNNVTRILRQKLFGRAKSSVSLNSESARQQARLAGPGGGEGGGGGGGGAARGMSTSHSAHSVGSAVALSAAGGPDAVVKLRAKKSKGLMSSSEHVYVVNREEKMLRPRSCATLPQDGKLGVVHENPRVSAEGVEHDDVRRLAADERYDAVSPVTVRLRNKQRRLSEEVTKRLSLPADIRLPENSTQLNSTLSLCIPHRR